MNETLETMRDSPMHPHGAAYVGLALACAILPFVFAIAGADPDKTGTHVAIWACALACAGVGFLIQRPKWQRWSKQRWG